MHVGSEQTERGLAALVGRMADSFSRLVTQHLQLARLELAEDLKATGMNVAMIAAFVPFILVGYAFACGALAAVLSAYLGWAGALGAVSLLNLVAGGGGIAWALQRLKARRMMDDTADELTRSMAALSTPAPVPVGNPLLKESSNGR
ncbi:phage holin family protein [Myxococcus sp. CA051A]|uniref:Phage holin family protein n=2 Tax=Myxococcus TaxID=32 RepID=A0A540WKB1_9BACT|nr:MULTISPECIES: phage holin family protein [Myxococcus]NTX03983.1 phage holin family protein [Myxococcus sp. CA040A]NTX13405.1 phage holin family protein [Myxococcus sp. CA056]NTX35735.1 phage holin family protein [Myxococcus sp. CA033]NTX61863.1 phage holin family protein [Myxococcus sp. CA051A]TQF09438.1 phage holin family protein [Myxococcus llanfairpwllgwyngyllgogerychwyrndrobwllllantysiliogogogochensis]